MGYPPLPPPRELPQRLPINSAVDNPDCPQLWTAQPHLGCRQRAGREHRLSLTKPIENPSGFSRTHVHDGTRLTGCTQTPAHQSQEPPHRGPPTVHSLDGRGVPPAAFPMVQDGRCRHPKGGSWVIFSRDDTGLHSAASWGGYGTTCRGWLLRHRGLPEPVPGGDNHKLQDGANHHHLPQARLTRAMAPAAAKEFTRR